MSNGVTLSDAKLYLNISSSTDDTNIQNILDAAEDFTTKYTGIVFYSSDSTAATYTDICTAVGRSIQTDNHPVLSVASITDTYSDTAVDSDYYSIGDKAIWRKSQYGVFCEDHRRYSVVYTAGYDSDDIPTGLKAAILMLCSKIYNNRDDSASYDGVASYNVLKFVDSTILMFLESYRCIIKRRI